MRTPSVRCQTGSVDLYRYRPDLDQDSGALPDESALIAAGVPCSVQPLSTEMKAAGKRTTQVTTYELWFFADFRLGLKDLVVWVDAGGTAHQLYVTGQLPQIGMTAAWRVVAQEVR